MYITTKDGLNRQHRRFITINVSGVDQVTEVFSVDQALEMMDEQYRMDQAEAEQQRFAFRKFRNAHKHE